MYKLTLTLLALIGFAFYLQAQDTVVVQTLTYDSTDRNYVFDFPPDDGTTYQKILMKYNMRCKGALISTGTDRNKGCGEWDYSCNTFIVDSSRVDSTVAFHPDHIISRFNGDVFPYVTAPTNTYYAYDQSEVVVNNIANENNYEVTKPLAEIADVLNINGNAGKYQMLLRSEDLTNAGVEAGPIQALQLIANNSGSVSFLKVRMNEQTTSTISSAVPYLGDAQTVYFKDTDLTEGVNTLYFSEDYIWDGNSNIRVEISYQSVSDPITLQGEEVLLLSTNTMDNPYALSFDGSQHINLDPTSMEAISNEITIAFWAYGSPADLPAATSILEGVDAQNRRQVNVHLPWSNSQVYWDCGSDGGNGYDRINKAATTSEIEGKWNHWVFTKNSNTGVMEIILNGQLWHSGTGKFNPIDISKFVLGTNISLNRPFYGKIDEFAVWKKALTLQDVQIWMHRESDHFNHPAIDDLLVYLSFDNKAVNQVVNKVEPSQDNAISGIGSWYAWRGEEMVVPFRTSRNLPAITLIQADIDKTINMVTVIDTVQNAPNAVTNYSVVGSDLVVGTTTLLYEAKDEVMLDEMGNEVNTYPIAAEGEINIESLTYFNKRPALYEIMSFVTPYGIFLDLGPEGKTWTFDMSDFAPILKGKKRMYLALGGQNQEEMDIQFLFIKGTPSREVLDIQQIWRPGSHCNFTNIQADNCFEPRMVNIHPDGEYFKIRTMITGHGQEGEFIPREHWISIDGQPEFAWDAWTECSDNPVYPQGGTWIYDRAGWCPGAPTDLQEFDITDIVIPGETHEIDYTVVSGAGDSRYLINHQLVTYGPYTVDYDLAIEDIMKPGNDVRFSRVNPSCTQPRIRVKNKGQNNIRKVQFTYGLEGGISESYEWEGNMRPDQMAEIELPISEGFWYSGDPRFYVDVDLPDNVDGNIDNNRAEVSFEYADHIQSDYVLLLMTANNFGNQNAMTIKDLEGNVVYQRSSFPNNLLVRDTLWLPNGCYQLRLTDSGGNGLDFWAQPNEGSGSFQLRDQDNTRYRFDPDFGAFINYEFTVENISTSTEELIDDSSVDVFPNPTSDFVQVYLDHDIDWEQMTISDMSGKILQQISLDRQIQVEVDARKFIAGTYLITVKTGAGGSITRRFVKLP